jgi:hypothetical protein
MTKRISPNKKEMVQPKQRHGLQSGLSKYSSLYCCVNSFVHSVEIRRLEVSTRVVQNSTFSPCKLTYSHNKGEKSHDHVTFNKILHSFMIKKTLRANYE